MRKLAILGAGSWGLTLAWLSAQSHLEREIWLWDRKPEKIDRFKANRAITFPVNVTLPESVILTSCLKEATEGADAVLFVVTTAGTREVAETLKALNCLSDTSILINASKGIEFPSLKSLSTILSEIFPDNPVAVLSGPTLAGEILEGLPTAGVVASKEVHVSECLQANLSRENRFRVYSNKDMIGVELGGALKNVFAIASGYIHAKGYGENARAALITRGLAEMTRFSVAMGADQQTLYGLSGLGDMLATCSSPLSRNYQVGLRLGKGEKLANILEDMRVVAEGVHTTRSVKALATQLAVDCPIVDVVEYALSGKPLSDEMLIRSLMSRKLKPEGFNADPVF
jgi:glycerol-3-phosphate dehydrogenase (NAD(P)+)